jgi:hypothetical protein
MANSAADGEMAINPADELDSAKARILDTVAARDEQIESLEKKFASMTVTKESVACQTGEPGPVDASSVPADPGAGPVTPDEITPTQIGLGDLPQKLIDMIVGDLCRRARWTTTQPRSRLSSIFLIVAATSSCALASSIVKTCFGC